jgi:hypothetical protein
VVGDIHAGTVVSGLLNPSSLLLLSTVVIVLATLLQHYSQKSSAVFYPVLALQYLKSIRGFNMHDWVFT